MSRTVAAVMAALALGACGGGESRIGVRYSASTRLPVQDLTVTLSGAGIHRTLSAADLTPAANGDFGDFETASSGDLTLAFVLRDGQAIVSQGRQTIPLKPDWRWEAEIRIDSLNPLRGCFGCVGTTAYAVDAAYQRSAADSLWITLGGNSISHPVVY